MRHLDRMVDFPELLHEFLYVLGLLRKLAFVFNMLILTTTALLIERTFRTNAIG